MRYYTCNITLNEQYSVLIISKPECQRFPKDSKMSKDSEDSDCQGGGQPASPFHPPPTHHPPPANQLSTFTTYVFQLHLVSHVLYAYHNASLRITARRIFIFRLHVCNLLVYYLSISSSDMSTWVHQMFIHSTILFHNSLILSDKTFISNSSDR